MATPSLIKQPSESRVFSMDFAALLAAGETLTAVTSVVFTPATTPNLVLNGAGAFSGSLAQQRIDAGKSGTQYKVTFVVQTSLGNTLEGEGLLNVKDL